MWQILISNISINGAFPMSLESHTADILAREFLHLPEPVRRAAMEFARQAEEICRSDRQGMDIAEIEQHVVGAVAATGLMLLKGLIEELDAAFASVSIMEAALKSNSQGRWSPVEDPLE